MKCTTQILDVPAICAVMAVLLASSGLIFSFSAVNVVATYCIWAYALYPRLIVHEITAMLLAGFVLTQTTDLAQLLYGSSYVFLLVSVTFEWQRLIEFRAFSTNQRCSQPEPTPPVNVDDI